MSIETVQKKKIGGLAGIVAGDSAICHCSAEEETLTYRGYSIEELAKQGSFEETAWLLLRGTLPNREQLTGYLKRLALLRQPPKALLQMLELIPDNANPMDVLRSCTSLLGNLEPESADQQKQEPYLIADRLIALLPAALLFWHARALGNKALSLESFETTQAGYFLHLLHGKAPSDEQRRCLDASLTLYAEHEFNASTFTVRTIASTMSDFYSAICGGIGALRGNLHGGANEAALELITSFTTPKEAEAGLVAMLSQKTLIMGFGHRVYTKSDPRSAIIKKWAKTLAKTASQQQLVAIAEAIEAVMWREKQLFPNLDFYSALAYHFCGIPAPLFTPLFAFARLSGWSAHLLEQRQNNKLIRPISNYIGPTNLPWKALDERR